jgi:hypothetical protein
MYFVKDAGFRESLVQLNATADSNLMKKDVFSVIAMQE